MEANIDVGEMIGSLTTLNGVPGRLDHRGHFYPDHQIQKAVNKFLSYVPNEEILIESYRLPIENLASSGKGCRAIWEEKCIEIRSFKNTTYRENLAIVKTILNNIAKE